ncbi:MAG: D-alanine--D-alanine ligase [Candidatus Nomurabacteria bacterium]|jgi:D-alanine-D-alanine ligase|nr:D-alanine--D-alanine ligase [Candidatus Nomurabacteria bacterium]
MNKQTIAVFFGGKSPEHDVSIVSAIASVIKPLKIIGHKVVPIYIAKNGNWYVGDELADIKTYQTGKVDEIIAKQKPVRVGFNDGLTIVPAGFRPQPIKIDIAFPVMHGAYGEDGSLMGLLRMAGVPFVGSDMEASAVAMNKVLSKEVAESNGIPTPRYVSFLTTEFSADRKKCIKKVNDALKYPVFVKPPHLGSSIGITKVKESAELENALEVAAYYDDVILVEEAVDNLIEITLPIIGNDELTLANVERPVQLTDEFFDFDSKYINGGKKGGGKKGGGKGKGGAQGYSEIPAKLPGDLYKQAEEVGKRVYRVVGLSGISRIDMLIDSKAEKVYFNEINPMPGSLYAHNWARAGISNVELVSRLLDLAVEAYEKHELAKTTFETSYLKQF